MMMMLDKFEIRMLFLAARTWKLIHTAGQALKDFGALGSGALEPLNLRALMPS